MEAAVTRESVPYLGCRFLPIVLVWLVRDDDGVRARTVGYLPMRPDGTRGTEMMDEAAATAEATKSLKEYVSADRKLKGK